MKLIKCFLLILLYISLFSSCATDNGGGDSDNLSYPEDPAKQADSLYQSANQLMSLNSMTEYNYKNSYNYSKGVNPTPPVDDLASPLINQ